MGTPVGVLKTSKLLWAKNPTFQLAKKSMLLSKDEKFFVLKIVYHHFFKYQRMCFDFCKDLGQKLFKFADRIS